jgi:prepilin-type N-terminal cleavage/methylation domain-containing protein
MEMRNKKGFTLVEVVTAIGILVVVVVFTGIIFKSSIESYRIAGANAEIIQNLQTITTQLDRDFSQIRRDGWLGIRVETIYSRPESSRTGSPTLTVHMDRIYYFTTGDFQSWEQGKNEDGKFVFIRSNIARIYFGHDSNSLYPPPSNPMPLDKCKLARDVLLLTPGITGLADCNDLSFVKFASDPNASGDMTILNNSVLAGTDANNIRQLMCENVGELKIEWMNGIDSSMKLIWSPNGGIWGPSDIWPKAIKFTFTLYDSKGILKGGSRFTHIVYLGN